MEIDTTTLRLVFAIVAATMLVLFFFDSFFSTRSAYSWWWCAVLMCVLVGSGASMLEGTSQQWWSVAAGNALLVLGAACSWTAARSLRGSPNKWWQIATPALATGAASLAADPGGDVWAGGAVFLAMMSLLFGLGATELLRTERARAKVRVSAVTSAVLACVYYFTRCITFVIDGPRGHVFSTYFSGQTTMVLTLMFLVVVSFGISALSSDQSHEDLRVQATHDGLTGLLNRTEFMRVAENNIRLMRRPGLSAAVILADLDNFKQINDTHGHDAGDRALQAFARACEGAVRSTDLTGRYGGEEFVLFLPYTSLDSAQRVTASISTRLQDSGGSEGFAMPTVSYGIAVAAAGTILAESMAAADTALYRAKRLGRNRAEQEKPVAARLSTEPSAG